VPDRGGSGWKRRKNRDAGIREAVPAARTTAVMAEGDGPSTESMPTAPSRPMTAVATVSPFAMSIISEMAPLFREEDMLDLVTRSREDRVLIERDRL